VMLGENHILTLNLILNPDLNPHPVRKSEGRITITITSKIRRERSAGFVRKFVTSGALSFNA